MRLDFRYDPEVDAGYVKFRDVPVDRTVDLESTELGLPILVDLDASGRLVGIEFLNVSITVPGLH